MCLKVKSNIPKIAEDDIFCYKVLQKCKGEGYEDCFLTPFQESLVIPSEINGLKHFCADRNFYPPKIEESNSLKSHYLVSSGFIHTYKSLAHAKYERDVLEENYDAEFFIFECIIPKGCEYFEGSDCDGFIGYASEKIKFLQALTYKK